MFFSRLETHLDALCFKGNPSCKLLCQCTSKASEVAAPLMSSDFKEGRIVVTEMLIQIQQIFSMSSFGDWNELGGKVLVNP